MIDTGDYTHVTEARTILVSLGLAVAQQNDRSALCLLALLNLPPDKPWEQAKNPLMGITPIIEWIRDHYQKEYAPNLYERAQS